MKHYFEVTYPRRIEELRLVLSDLTKSIYDNIDNAEIAQDFIKQFKREINKFGENTKLHMMSKRDKMTKGDLIYLTYCRHEYFIKYFESKGNLKTAKICRFVWDL